jgi:hypothetical protein
MSAERICWCPDFRVGFKDGCVGGAFFSVSSVCSSGSGLDGLFTSEGDIQTTCEKHLLIKSLVIVSIESSFIYTNNVRAGREKYVFGE